MSEFMPPLKLLFVSPSFPYPPRRGFEMLSYHRIRLLSLRHSIVLAFIDDGTVKPDDLDHMRSFCERLIPLPLSKFQKATGVFRSLFSNKPLQVGMYNHPILARILKKVCSDGSFDILHAYMLRLSGIIPAGGPPVVIDLIDSMIVNFERRIPFASWPMKLLLWEEVRRLRRYEPAVASQHTHVLVSEMDRDAINQNGDVIPLGVDTSIFYPGGKRDCPKSILFSGNMFYSPNLQAVEWFLAHCWPTLHARHPALTFRIAGNGPPAGLLAKHGCAGILVLGSVPSVADEIRRTSVAVAPMQSGSGMQFKILEAMACATPVVATSRGLGAIRAIGNTSIVIADDPASTIDAIECLLGDDRLAMDIGNGGLDVVRRIYTWEAHCIALNSLYSRVLASTLSHLRPVPPTA